VRSGCDPGVACTARTVRFVWKRTACCWEEASSTPPVGRLFFPVKTLEWKQWDGSSRGDTGLGIRRAKVKVFNSKIIMKKQSNPSWWTEEHNSGWDRVKAAFRRDWDQTKHDFGGAEPETNQDVDNTVKQAAGKEAIPPRGEPAYEDAEPGYRFGHGARNYYGTRYPNGTPIWRRRFVETGKPLTRTAIGISTPATCAKVGTIAESPLRRRTVC